MDLSVLRVSDSPAYRKVSWVTWTFPAEESGTSPWASPGVIMVLPAWRSSGTWTQLQVSSDLSRRADACPFRDARLSLRVYWDLSGSAAPNTWWGWRSRLPCLSREGSHDLHEKQLLLDPHPCQVQQQLLTSGLRTVRSRFPMLHAEHGQEHITL